MWPVLLIWRGKYGRVAIIDIAELVQFEMRVVLLALVVSTHDAGAIMALADMCIHRAAMRQFSTCCMAIHPHSIDRPNSNHSSIHHAHPSTTHLPICRLDLLEPISKEIHQIVVPAVIFLPVNTIGGSAGTDFAGMGWGGC